MLQASENQGSPDDRKRKRYSVSAKPGPNGKQERDPTKGLTYEELSRDGGRKRVVVEELEGCWRECGGAYPIETEVDK